MRLDRETSRALWRAARTPLDLCRLGARFMAGEITHFPGWVAPELDEESDEIRAQLLRLCELGLLTLASQPARPDQRAFVAGFAFGATAAKLKTCSSELDVRLFGHSECSTIQEPISRADGRFHAFAGHDARREELECFEDDVSPALMRALECAVYVSAFDPVWDRRELLWSELLRALSQA
ncbi:MAG: hypothetical protein JNL28_08390 [Planctomycetes bacterium]|nr:hypothetical protein [Planctomycetota bacterium]